MRYLFCLLLSLNAFANDINSYHQDGSAFAKILIPSAASFDQSVLPENFTANPLEYQYSDNQLSNSQSFKNNDAAEFIKQNFTQRPQFVLDKQELITANDRTCVEIPDCETTYQVHTCEEAIHSKEHSCSEDLIINVHQPKMVSETIKVRVDTISYDDTFFYIDMTTGELLKITGKKAHKVTATASLSSTIPESACPSLTVTKGNSQMIAERGFRTKRTVVWISKVPACENNLIAVVAIKQKKGKKKARRGGIYEFKVQYQPPRAVQSEHWQNNCSALEDKANNGICRLIKEECVDGPSEKNISGLNIKRDCWKKKRSYDCHYAKSQNNCEAYRNKGCEQTFSQCSQKTADGLCAVHKQTYRCPIKDCSKTKTICADTGFCTNGNCDTEESKPNQDFQKAITTLSALKEAGTSLDEKLNQIFKGTRKTCRTAFSGFRDCCKDKGWGIDLSLTECKTKEEELGLQKQKGQCHYVGKYCSKKVLGKCVEKKKAYCCFQSKLGRLVQEQGRLQLNQGWGSGKRSICTGLTPEQLQSLDFSKMDLDEFYQDVTDKTKLTNFQETSQKVQERIKAFYQENGQ